MQESDERKVPENEARRALRVLMKCGWALWRCTRSLMHERYPKKKWSRCPQPRDFDDAEVETTGRALGDALEQALEENAQESHRLLVWYCWARSRLAEYLLQVAFAQAVRSGLQFADAGQAATDAALRTLEKMERFSFELPE